MSKSYKSMTVEELDAMLDQLDAEKQALKARAVEVMAVRNRKIAEESLRARENPTPVIGLPDQNRIAALRVKAGVVEVGGKARGM